MSPKAAVILNPRAASGKTTKHLPHITRELIRCLECPVEVLLTEYPNHASELTKQALINGCSPIVAVGGDGTANEVVNGWFNEEDEPISCGAKFGFIPIGTGGDLRRTLGIPSDITAAAECIARGRPEKIDVAKASFVSLEGQPLSRYFVNVASFGMGGEVSSRAKKSFLCNVNGKAAFLYATAAVFFTYKGKQVQLSLDGQVLPGKLGVANVAGGNGRYQGGGMQPCPRAVMDDGLLEITTIPQLTTREFIQGLPVLYSDNIYRHPKVSHYRATSLYAESEEVTLVELDGEALGKLPLEIKILPACLQVLTLGIET